MVLVPLENKHIVEELDDARAAAPQQFFTVCSSWIIYTRTYVRVYIIHDEHTAQTESLVSVAKEFVSSNTRRSSGAETHIINSAAVYALLFILFRRVFCPF